MVKNARVAVVVLLCHFGAAVASSLSTDRRVTTSVHDSKAPPTVPVAADARAAPCGLRTITQNTDPTAVLAPGSSVACLDNTNQCTLENEFARSFNLASGATAGVAHRVRCVEYGISSVLDTTVGASPVTIRLYIDANGAAPDMANLTILGSVNDEVPTGTTGARRVVDFSDQNVIVPANATLVVSVLSPDLCALRGPNHSHFNGVNSAGQSAASYIRVPDCGAADFVTLASLGFPNQHMVLNVGLDHADGTCVPDWSDEFQLPDVNDTVFAMAEFDDGTGPALYVAGTFTEAAGEVVNRVVKWDGAAWTALGNGVSGTVRALAVYDDGSGPALYAGGSFTTAGGVTVNNIAKWNGALWSALGAGVNSAVFSLAVFDDGSGPALHVGGSFTSADGVAGRNRVAKWDGAAWSGLGSGLSAAARSMVVFDDGTGPALHVGGEFTTAGGAAAGFLAKWDGSVWSPLGSGVNARVYALALFDVGGGTALFAGGSFTQAGGNSAGRIAKWDGAVWSDLNTGIPSGLTASIVSLRVFDDGNGPELYVGSDITTIGGVTVNDIAKWDGATWSALGSGMAGITLFTSVEALIVFDDGGGPALYAGGLFSNAGPIGANNIARWKSGAWSPMGGPGKGLNGAVRALLQHDDGDGAALFVTGDFTNAGGVSARNVAKWDGTTWHALGAGLDGPGNALAVYDDGAGTGLYVAGDFLDAGGITSLNVAQWDGSAWSALGAGGTNVGVAAEAFALTVHDDGSGSSLIVGGRFTLAGGAPGFNRIAKWDGLSWSPLGSGMDSDVLALRVFDPGTGPRLFAGGIFSMAGGAAANHVAQWNGVSWSSLGAGVNDFVNALEVFDPGSGAELYVAGRFTSAGGVGGRNSIARWTGSSWLAVGSGIDSEVKGLLAFDDGGGSQLYAGGFFTLAGGVPVNRVARWNGGAWSSVGAGVLPQVDAFGTFDDGKGPTLFAGGPIKTAGARPSSNIAAWRAQCPASLPPAPGDDVCSGGSNAGASCSVNGDCPDGACGLKNRYVSITPANDLGGSPSSIQLCVTSMHACAGGGRDGLLCQTGVDCPGGACMTGAVVGDCWWAGPPTVVPNSPLPSAFGAPLNCEATPSHAEVWPVEVLHLFGAVVAPGGAYEVRMCDAAGLGCSTPLAIATNKWGDVVPPFGGGSQPNFGDISAIVGQFRSSLAAPGVLRADLRGPGSPATANTADRAVDFSDISAAVSGFQGTPFPFPLPICP